MPPTTPPTMAPMLVLFEEGLSSPSSSGVVDSAGVLLVDVLEVDVVEVEVVLADESMTAWGSSFIDMMVGWGKQRYIDRAGVPVQRKVPHAPKPEDWLDMC
jgi:hypothetical protein